LNQAVFHHHQLQIQSHPAQFPATVDLDPHQVERANEKLLKHEHEKFV